MTWQIKALRLYLETMLLIQERRKWNGESFRLLRECVTLHAGSNEEERLAAIVALRRRIARNPQEVVVEDFGADGSPQGTRRRTTVSSLHRTSAIPHWWGVLLFRLVREFRPRWVVELGTSLGVSACYIQSALDLNRFGQLMTLEGSEELARQAERHLAELSTSRVRIVVGRFHDTLESRLRQIPSVDMAFLDGHHTCEATVEYHAVLASHAALTHCMVFDDIYPWSLQMRKAWKRITAQNQSAIAFDTAKLGILLKRGESA